MSIIRDLDVVVVCEINVDIVVAGLDALPRFGAEHEVSDVLLTAGSSGVLTATGLADLGLRVGICGLINNDPFGRFMLEHCAHHGIDQTGIVVDNSVRTGASVLLSGSVDRAILTYPGAMARFSLDQVRSEVLARARHLHLSSYFLQRALRPDVPELLARARAAGITASADTGHDPDEQWEIDRLLANLDLFLPSEVEARAISGMEDINAALEWLVGQVPTVAIKCGADGAVAACVDERVRLPGFSIQVVDTTGAGDAFNAGFLSAWLAGRDLTTCVDFGNACGALTASHLGGTGAVNAARVEAVRSRQC